MAWRASFVAWMFLVSCSGAGGSSDEEIQGNPLGNAAAGACATGHDCVGGVCLGAVGQPQEGNERFAGGYCTSIRCTVGSQEGCGPDEFCIDGGGELGGFCVQLCSKADGLVCDREDHVCIGIDAFGGCFSRDAVECHVQERTGCEPAETCVRIGFDDRSLGRCETSCDPMRPRCPEGRGCYFIRTYSTAICNLPGTGVEEEPCMCDRCCEPGLSCTPDLDGEGRHCKRVCDVVSREGCVGEEMCVPLKVGSPWGGCVAPGSAGT
jgi:hypothetical protein